MRPPSAVPFGGQNGGHRRRDTKTRHKDELLIEALGRVGVIADDERPMQAVGRPHGSVGDGLLQRLARSPNLGITVLYLSGAAEP